MTNDKGYRIRCVGIRIFRVQDSDTAQNTSGMLALRYHFDVTQLTND
jgi:hypothetical protein